MGEYGIAGYELGYGTEKNVKSEVTEIKKVERK